MHRKLIPTLWCNPHLYHSFFNKLHFVNKFCICGIFVTNLMQLQQVKIVSTPVSHHKFRCTWKAIALILNRKTNCTWSTARESSYWLHALWPIAFLFMSEDWSVELGQRWSIFDLRSLSVKLLKTVQTEKTGERMWNDSKIWIP